MARRKKITFKLSPEWMFKEPIDFEYNKYTLLNYLQKCDENFNNFKIYPDFVELSLHIANMQSLLKENLLLLTDKKFKSCDDEILLKELYPKKPRKITSEEKKELEKTLKYSNIKLIDAFNLAKSIWSVAFDSITINLKKNKDTLIVGSGFVVYIENGKTHIWEYGINKSKEQFSNLKMSLNKIYEEAFDESLNLNNILEQVSTWKEVDFLKRLPVFEVKSTQSFPIDETIVPLIKRKLLSLIIQSANTQSQNKV